MGKLYFILPVFIAVLFTSTGNAQSWKANLPQGKVISHTLTLADYRQAFNSYWAPYHVVQGYYYENGVKKKAPGWKQFKRWEWYWESRVDRTTGAFPATTAEEQFHLYNAKHPLPKSSNGNWVNLGTNSSTGGYAGVGRINCIAFHPSNNNIYWVGAPSGGLWMTTNNGTSWTCLTNNNAELGVSDIVIPSDYATSNTIYIATGDRDAWDNRSAGVLKSTDGGTTWSATGLSYTPSQNKMVTRLLLDPNNNSNIIAATSNGVYKTTDGGTTWPQLTATSFVDMEYKPGNFNTLYGSTGSGGIYVSTNGGTSWTQTMNLASGYRVEMAVSAAQPTWVYAIVAQSDNSLLGIYKSTNSGNTFTSIYSTLNLLCGDASGTGTGGQGWYDLSIASSPTNANIVLIGGVNTWRSTNGGTAWAIVNHWWGDGVQAVHADKHMLKFRSNGDLFECNDGGVYISASPSNGASGSWTDKTNGMVTSQMYRLGNSKTVTTEVITGLQDNGTKLLSGGTWSDVKGGDGMECIIDYTNVNIQYGTYVDGQIDRTTDHWNTTTDISANIPGGPDGAWVTPYIIDPGNAQILYVGYADIWKTTNRGDTWTQISTMNSSDRIRSMAIAPSNTQVLYVADPSNIWKTTNGGTLWTNITGTLPVSNASITYIAVKNNDPNTLWVTLSGYTSPGVWQSTNGGTTWTNFSTGLPTIPCNTIVQNKLNTTTNELYVGTDFGVYFKNGASNWVLFNTGLPNVVVDELEIWYGTLTSNSKLRAATYGRGLWESDLYYVSGTMTYVSCTTTQPNVSAVAPNQNNQEIIGVKIVTSGGLNPLNATTFTFNTNGSTNASIDITHAKVFFTGGSSIFSTAAQFGTTCNAPNGTFTITGTQALSDGTNYFWLTYDIPNTATIGNFLDAQCTSLTVVTARTPAVTNPAGNRPINVVYCSASGVYCDEYISNVTIGTLNNSSACTTGGYADYTAMPFNLQIGASLPITVTNGNPTYPVDQCGIWVDWNENADFTDDPAITVTGTPGTGPYTATISAPGGTNPGLVRMRIRIHYNDEVTAPCDTAHWGEVEDYAINLLPNTSLPVADFIVSNTNPCLSEQVFLTDVSSFSPNTWKWTISPPTYNFMGGTMATSQNPGVQFTAAGSYTVKLRISNVNGADSVTKYSIIDVINSVGSGISAVQLGTSYNAFSVIHNPSKQLIYNPSTNLLAFIHRNNPNMFGGTSGQLRYDFSIDTGATWQNNVGLLNPSTTYQARYPQLSFYNPAGNTNYLNSYLVYHAPILNPSWKGYVGGVRKMNATGTTEHYNQAGTTNTLIPGGLCQSVSGTYWAVDNIYDSAANKTTGFKVIKGVWNVSDVTWTNSYTITPVFDVSYDGNNHFSDYGIAFSANGQIGYILLLTHLSGTTSYKQYSPAYYKTVNGGNTWVGPNYIDLNSFPNVTAFVPGGYYPDAGWQADVTVDYNDHPHFFIGVHYGDGTNYSIFYPSMLVDVTTQNGTTFYASEVAKANTFYYDIDGNGTYMYNELQLCTSPDKKSIFYGWVDSDTAGGNYLNNAPNLYMRCYSAEISSFGAVKSITRCSTISGAIYFPKLSLTAIVSNNIYQIPAAYTVFTVDGDPNVDVNYNYIKGIKFSLCDMYPVPAPLVTTMDSTACQGDSVLLNCTATPGCTVAWYRNGSLITGAAAYQYYAKTSGIYVAKETNTCHPNTPSNAVNVLIEPLPQNAGVISGTASVCQGNTVIYSVPVITNASSYIWTLPAGATGTSSTNSITVFFGPSAVSGNITVTGHSGCGDGGASTLAITVGALPVNAGTITGPATVCQGQSSVTYTVPVITNATTYIWILPAGITGTSNTNSITVNIGLTAVSGNIAVLGHDPCGDGASSTMAITVNIKPATPVVTLNGSVLLSGALSGNQWYDLSGSITGATNQFYVVTSDGDYYVIATVNGCSSDPSDTIHVVITGIGFSDNNNEISIYPNPVSNDLTMEYKRNTVKIGFNIYNSIGQRVIRGKLLERTTIKTSNLSAGVYIVKFENGITVVFKKIVKE